MAGELAGVAAVAVGTVVLMAAVVWAMSLPLRDVSIVDIAWGWLVAAPGIVFALATPPDARGAAVLAVVLAWAARLSLHIAWRHRGQPEDRRYQEIRARNAPNFPLKSLYLVFGLQAVLACVVALPVVASVVQGGPWSLLCVAGIALALAGLAWEAVADAQLARFRSAGAHRGQVMQKGLWRFSRHPNYFGEFCLWWGLWIVAAEGGAWWSIASPLLMTVLLLRVSGVTLLEKEMARRPGYADYVRRTNAFFPWVPRA